MRSNLQMKKLKSNRLASAKHCKPSLLDNRDTKDRIKAYTPVTDREKYSHLKVIKSGKYYEVYEYEIPIRYNFSNNSNKKNNKSKNTKKENRARAIHRAKGKVKRLILTNFDNQRSKFITLTFSDNNNFDIKDIKACNKEFKKFIQRLRRKSGNFKYLSVIEIQKRGAIHYHMIADLDYIDSGELEAIWRNGFIKINKIKQIKNIGSYLTKYMVKDIDDPRLRGEKSYFCSQKLNQPIDYKGPRAYELDEWLQKEYSTTWQSTYDSEMNGKVKYKEYNLNVIIR